jgi:hypothetical protein
MNSFLGKILSVTRKKSDWPLAFLGSSKNYNYPFAKNNILIFFIFFLLGLFLIFCGSRGLDLTDQAYFLGNKSWLNHYYFPVWGSGFITNITRSIFGDYSFVLLKIFSQLLPLIVLFFLLFLSGNFVERSDILKINLLLLVPWVGRSVLGDWIYYSTLSGFLLTIAILCFYNSLERNNVRIFYVASFLVFFSVLVKITNLVFLSFIPFSYYFFLKKNQKKPSIWIVVSLFLIFPVLFLVSDHHNLFINEGLFLFKSLLTNTKTHSFDFLIKKNIGDFLASLKISFLFGFVFYLMLKIQDLKISEFLISGLSFVLTFSIFIIFKSFSVLKMGELFVFYFISLVALGVNYIKIKNISKLYLTILLFLFLSFNSLGSNNGLMAAFVAEPIVVFVSFIIISTTFEKRNFFWICFLLFLLGVNQKLNFPYRDLPRTHLTQSTMIPKLKGVISNKSKIDALESIYVFKEKFLKNEKIALIYPSAPLLYYILNFKPFLENPWINLYPEKVLRTLLYKTSEKPDVVIRLKQNPRRATWPRGNPTFQKDQDLNSTNLLDAYVSKKKFKLIWENAYFGVYSMK